MSMNPTKIVVVLQTVRLPHGSDQFVIPADCTLSRTELSEQLGWPNVDASQTVVQPETGREGTERLVALGTDGLSQSDKVDLTALLRTWLIDAPAIIDEVASPRVPNAAPNADGRLPTSSQLAQWQATVNQRFRPNDVSKPTSPPADSPVKISAGRMGKLIAMFTLLGSLIVATIVLVPPIFRGWTDPSCADQRPANTPASDAQYEGWNLAEAKEFVGQADLLLLLRPLVIKAQAQPDPQPTAEVELAQLLDQINHVRLAQPFDDPDSDSAEEESNLADLLSDDVLNSYIRKLFADGGNFDCFGLVEGHPKLDELKALLPENVETQTATEFRRLAHQLIGESPLGESGKPITQLDTPFFDLADAKDQRRSFDAMAEANLRSFRNVNVQHAFFTPDDCAAAKEIFAYFTDIGFLSGGKLGFPDNSPLSGRARSFAKDENAKARDFAILLIQWEAFTEGDLRKARPSRTNDDEPTVTDTR